MGGPGPKEINNAPSPEYVRWLELKGYNVNGTSDVRGISPEKCLAAHHRSTESGIPASVFKKAPKYIFPPVEAQPTRKVQGISSAQGKHSVPKVKKPESEDFSPKPKYLMSRPADGAFLPRPEDLMSKPTDGEFFLSPKDLTSKYGEDQFFLKPKDLISKHSDGAILLAPPRQKVSMPSIPNSKDSIPKTSAPTFSPSARGTENPFGAPPPRTHHGRKPKRHIFPTRYFVEPLVQPNRSACFPTAMLMLVKYRDSIYGQFIYHSELEGEVFASNGAESLRKLTELQNFCIEHGFLNSEIETKPQAFEIQLKKSGPFAYIARAGNGYQHTLVITGIEEVSGYTYVYYNDPDGGQKKKEDFYEFIIEHKPAFTGNMDRAFIISTGINFRK